MDELDLKGGECREQRFDGRQWADSDGLTGLDPFVAEVPAKGD